MAGVVGQSERRRFLRRPAGFPVRIVQRDGRGERIERDVRAVDISESGMLLQFPTGRPASNSLTAKFSLPPGVLPDPYVRRYRLRGRVVRCRPPRAGVGSCRVGMEFESNLGQKLRRGTWRVLSTLGVFLIIGAVSSIVVLKIQALDYFWYNLSFGVYGLVVTTYILSRFLIASFYRPPRDAGHRPSVSVIVAAKNEEGAIGRTLEQIFASDYPAELLQVIAVDDGSTDRTYEEMARVERRHPGLRLIRFQSNRGKRHAMAAGARTATGDILVYVDSDSFLERNALQRLVQGFADPGVAAVCAHGFAANAWKNALTRMQAVQYFIAFRVLKAAESVFSSVTCCSGCCAAYRKSAVLPILDRWLNQTFLGRPATFGDDRSLTNFMLRKHKVIYDETAHVSTIVPEDFRQFFRQQLRWKKSWLRENLIASTFMWKKPPIMAIGFYVGFLFPIFAPLVVGRALVYLPLAHGRLNHFYLLGLFLISLLYSSYYLVHQKNRMWMHGVVLCFFYSIVLTWQLPWAILTSWNNKWGTR